MQRSCPKCPEGQGYMKGQTQEIPMGVPYAFTPNPTIDLEPYIPNNIPSYKYYAIFKCTICGFVEFFLYNIKG